MQPPVTNDWSFLHDRHSVHCPVTHGWSLFTWQAFGTLSSDTWLVPFYRIGIQYSIQWQMIDWSFFTRHTFSTLPSDKALLMTHDQSVLAWQAFGTLSNDTWLTLFMIAFCTISNVKQLRSYFHGRQSVLFSWRTFSLVNHELFALSTFVCSLPSIIKTNTCFKYKLNPFTDHSEMND